MQKEFHKCDYINDLEMGKLSRVVGWSNVITCIFTKIERLESEKGDEKILRLALKMKNGVMSPGCR